MIALCRWAPSICALPMLLLQSVDAAHRPKRSMHSMHTFHTALHTCCAEE